MLYIFDFDYTLVDSSKGIVKSCSVAFKKIKCPVPSEKSICDTIGMPLKAAFLKLGGIPEKFSVFKAAYDRVSQNCIIKSAQIYSDTFSVLRAIKEDPANKIAVLSAKDRETIVKICNKFGLGGLIDLIVGGDDVPYEKPSAECVNYILTHFITSSEQAVYIGDSTIDSETAKNAGVRFVGVLTGITSPVEFGFAGCTSYVETLTDALKITLGQRIFLSWSGQMSRMAAEKFAGLLADCLGSYIKSSIFFSPKIEKGLVWAQEIVKNIKNAAYGVAFVTKNNISSPWMLYEIGGLSCRLSRVPYLYVTDVPENYHGPFEITQAGSMTAENILEIVVDIARTTGYKFVISPAEAKIKAEEYVCGVAKLAENYYYDLPYLDNLDNTVDNLIESQLDLIAQYIRSLYGEDTYDLHVEIQVCDFVSETRFIKYARPYFLNGSRKFPLYYSDMGELIKSHIDLSVYNDVECKIKPMSLKYWEEADEQHKQRISKKLRCICGFPILHDGQIIAVLEIHFFDKNSYVDFSSEFETILTNYEVKHMLGQYVGVLDYLLTRVNRN